MDDISAPLDGYILPQAYHVEQLIELVRAWDRAQPLVAHCHAGISRSSAAAFVCGLCAGPEPGRAHDRARGAQGLADGAAEYPASSRSPTDCSAGTAAWSPPWRQCRPTRPCYSEALPFRIDLE